MWQTEALFLSAGSCQNPHHVTEPNRAGSRTQCLKTIYRWDVFTLRWLGGKEDCHSVQSSKLENHASSGTNNLSSWKESCRDENLRFLQKVKVSFDCFEKSGVSLFILCVSLALSSLPLTLICGPSMAKKTHGRLDQQRRSKASKHLC